MWYYTNIIKKKFFETARCGHPTVLQKTAKRFFARGLAAAEDWRPARP